MFEAAQFFPGKAKLRSQAPLHLFGFHERGSQPSNFLRFGGPRTSRFDLSSVARYVLPRDQERCHCHPGDCSPKESAQQDASWLRPRQSGSVSQRTDFPLKTAQEVGCFVAVGLGVKQC